MSLNLTKEIKGNQPLILCFVGAQCHSDLLQTHQGKNSYSLLRKFFVKNFRRLEVCYEDRHLVIRKVVAAHGHWLISDYFQELRKVDFLGSLR